MIFSPRAAVASFFGVILANVSETERRGLFRVRTVNGEDVLAAAESAKRPRCDWRLAQGVTTFEPHAVDGGFVFVSPETFALAKRGFMLELTEEEREIVGTALRARRDALIVRKSNAEAAERLDTAISEIDRIVAKMDRR